MAEDLRQRQIAWESTGDGEFPYQATVDGRNLTVRIGDFPAESFYTLLVEGIAVTEFDNWPLSWRRPPSGN